jgi:hypothetical protein
MERIIEKLNLINYDDKDTEFNDWSLEEKKKLLEIYAILCKKETCIFDLIYRYHGCDSWEDIFRDYDTTYLQDKTKGVEIAIREIQERIEENGQGKQAKLVTQLLTAEGVKHLEPASQVPSCFANPAPFGVFVEPQASVANQNPDSMSYKT